MYRTVISLLAGRMIALIILVVSTSALASPHHYHHGGHYHGECQYDTDCSYYQADLKFLQFRVGEKGFIHFLLEAYRFFDLDM